MWWRAHGSAAGLFIVAVTLVVLAFWAPAVLRIPNRVWWRFAQALGWVNVRVLLTLFFFVVLTPVGYAMRLFRYDPLRARQAAGWLPYSERCRNRRHYEHLF
jgi:hypothetical protein